MVFDESREHKENWKEGETMRQLVRHVGVPHSRRESCVHRQRNGGEIGCTRIGAVRARHASARLHAGLYAHAILHIVPYGCRQG